MSAGRRRLAVFAWGFAVVLALAACVGAIDSIRYDSNLGRNLIRFGIGGGITLAALALVLTRGAPDVRRKFGVVAFGVWPFASFILFLSWQIGLSVEQAGACEAGDGEACAVLASRKARRGKHDEARRYATLGCAQSNRAACMALGTDLLYGLGGPTDHPRSLELLDDACLNDGNGLACNLAAGQYHDGLGTPDDPDTARDRFGRACELGIASACDAGTR